MISLKLKLVVYFLVLSLLPLAAGYASPPRSKATAAASRRAPDNRAARATAEYEERLAAARAGAEELSMRKALHDALRDGDRAALRRLAPALRGD